MPSFTLAAFFAASAAPVGAENKCALLLGQGRTNMEHEQVGIRAGLDKGERNSVRHRAADELHVAGHEVELHDRGKLRPT